MVLLITMDTTRADAIGAYGGPPTPTLDGLAARGVRYHRAFTHAPTTLSAHTSLMSGRDPHGHWVPRNGFVLPPDLPLLAEAMRAGGVETIGVIAASVLAPDTGIARGFDRFDAQFEGHRTKGRRHEITATEVTDRALAAIDQRVSDRPILLWVHYFDPHAPYVAPSPFAEQHLPAGSPPPWFTPENLPMVGKALLQGRIPREELAWLVGAYQAEVAYMDAEIGRLCEGLAQRGLLEKAWVVAVADHGESLGDLTGRPIGHGFDIDGVVTRVPLIIAPPVGVSWSVEKVIDTPVALSQIPNTLLNALGLPPLEGASPALPPVGSALPYVFLEATKPERDPPRVWNNLTLERGVVGEGALLIRSPLFGPLWSLTQIPPDMGEVTDPGVKARLRIALQRWDEAAPAPQTPHLDPATEEALRALGYLEPEAP